MRHKRLNCQRLDKASGFPVDSRIPLVCPFWSVRFAFRRRFWG